MSFEMAVSPAIDNARIIWYMVRCTHVQPYRPHKCERDDQRRVVSNRRKEKPVYRREIERVKGGGGAS